MTHVIWHTVSQTCFILVASDLLLAVDPSIHVALDVYALIAVTPSLETLNVLLVAVKADNDRRYLSVKEGRGEPQRELDVRDFYVIRCYIPKYN